MAEDLDRIFQHALAHHQAGRRGKAEAGYRAVLARDPDHLGALAEFGRLAFELGHPQVAAGLIGRVVARAPRNVQARNNLGNALEMADRFDEALALHAGTVALQPDYPEVYNSLGNLYDTTYRFDLAALAYRRAVALAPQLWQGWSNLGTLLHRAARDDAAVAAYRQALALHDHDELHHNLSTVLLARGNYDEGWREYERRGGARMIAPTWQDFPQPRWRGQDAPGQTVLIHAEQGFGDTLQFCRYVPLVAARGLRVILQVQPALVRLMRLMAGPALVVARGEALPAFDLHCPMLSLPLAFGTTVATVPSAVPYLSADPATVEAWRQRLAGDPHLKVGLVWAGNPDYAKDRQRSIPAEWLAPLLACPGVTFYSLQKDGRAPAGVVDLMGEMPDFVDTAAFVANLDLVIAVDTAVGHLAGAVGRPVWLLNRFDTDWRWLRDRDDSPWYPRLREFRQTAPGRWDDVISAVRAALSALT